MSTITAKMQVVGITWEAAQLSSVKAHNTPQEERPFKAPFLFFY
jgi:hypothetical protein